MTPEARVKTLLRTRLVEKFPTAYVAAPIGTPYGRRGVPDLLVCVHGTFVGIEVKAHPEGKPTPLQHKALEAIEAAGGVALVCAGRAAVERVLESIESVVSP